MSREDSFGNESWGMGIPAATGRRLLLAKSRNTTMNTALVTGWFMVGGLDSMQKPSAPELREQQSWRDTKMFHELKIVVARRFYRLRFQNIPSLSSCEGSTSRNFDYTPQPRRVTWILTLGHGRVGASDDIFDRSMERALSGAV